ncbi:MAG: translocation/assembly module TamB domain-containing protein [Balneolaceae bacterium]
MHENLQHSESAGMPDPSRSGRGWQRAGWLLILCLTGLLLLRLSLKSDWLLDRVRMLAVEQVNRQLNGEITLDRLEGDLLSEWTLYGVEIRGVDGTSVGRAGRVRVRYHPVRLLTGKELDLLEIDSLDVTLSEDSEGGWNVQKLLPEPDSTERSGELFPFRLHQLILDHADLSVSSPSLPDDSLRISDLALRASAGYRSGEWDVSLGDLRMRLRQGRLPRDLDVAMAGGLDGEEITLERFVVSSGRSWIRSRGSALLKPDGPLDVDIGLDPLAVEDLKAWDLEGLERDVTADIRFSGTLSEPVLRLDLQAGSGLRHIRLEGAFEKAEETYAIRSLGLELQELDGVLLTGREGMPSIHHLRLDFAGTGSISDPLSSSLQAEMDLEGLRLSGRTLLDHVQLDGRFQERQFQFSGRFHRDLEEVQIDGSGSVAADAEPEWEFALNGDSLDLRTWWEGVTREVILSPQLEVSGRGLALEEPVRFDLQLNDSRMLQESIDTLRLSGSFTRDSLSMDLYGRPLSGTLQVNLQASLQPDDAGFQWVGQFDDLNIGRFFPMEDFPTRLNGQIEGRGSGWSREMLALDAEMQLDSSQVNREWIETLRGEFQVRNERLLVAPLRIESPMVSGSVELNHHLMDVYDEQNRMEIDLELKNSAPFAPLVGVENLQGSGSVRARLYRSEEGDLLYEGEGVLTEVVVGEFFRGEETTWDISGVRSVGSEGQLRFHSREMQIQGYPVREIDLEARLTDLQDRIQGDLLLTVLQSEDHEVRWAGGLYWGVDERRLTSRELDVRAPQERIMLMNPFEVVMTDSTLSVGEIHMQSDRDEAWMKVQVPGWSADRKEISMEVEAMDLATLQEALTGDVYGEALASGWVHLVEESGEWEGESRIEFREVQWVDAGVDRIQIDGVLENGELRFEGSGEQEGVEFLDLSLQVPFAQGDPAGFANTFFDHPVEGRIDVRGRDLSWWSRFVPADRRPDLGGELQIRSELSGVAGSPAFDGGVRVVNPRLSGLDLDDLQMEWEYRHNVSELRVDGYLDRAGNRVATLEGVLPLELDMRELRRLEPVDSDPVYLEVRSDQIDLALFSSLLPRDQFRDLRGRLTGFWRAEGQVGDVESTGEWRLREGRVRVVPLNLSLQGVEADLTMAGRELTLDRFVVRSGPGRATLQGRMDISNGLNPELDLSLTARQLQVANRNNLNAIIDLDSRLTGSLQAAELSGNLTFRSGFVQLENFGEESVEDVELESDESGPSMYDQMVMELSVVFDRQFFIRNRQYLDMEVELVGEVDLVKESGGELEMFGALEGVNGYARPLGRQFDLDQALVTFYGPVDNPELEIRTQHTPQRSTEVVTLWYIIEGTVQDPEFRFDSDPYLELQDILSYTLFGRPFYALESWQQALSGGSGDSSAADVAMEILIERFGANAARQLGVDVVEVENNRTGSGNRTTIKTGWYLGDRTFFAVLNEISGSSPKTLFMLEYMLTKNLELLVTQGDDSRQGIDLRWTREY